MLLGSISGRIGIVLIATAWVWSSPEVQAQTPASGGEKKSGEKDAPAADRQKALALFYAHQNLEALPLLEELARTNPADREVRESLAVVLYTQSAARRDRRCVGGDDQSWRS
jgi:hypothetical protein